MGDRAKPPHPRARPASAGKPGSPDAFVVCLIGLIALMILSALSIMALTLWGGSTATPESWPRFLQAIDIFRQVLLTALGCVVGMLGAKAASR